AVDHAVLGAVERQRGHVALVLEGQDAAVVVARLHALLPTACLHERGGRVGQAGDVAAGAQRDHAEAGAVERALDRVVTRQEHVAREVGGQRGAVAAADRHRLVAAAEHDPLARLLHRHLGTGGGAGDGTGHALLGRPAAGRQRGAQEDDHYVRHGTHSGSPNHQGTAWEYAAWRLLRPPAQPSRVRRLALTRLPCSWNQSRSASQPGKRAETSRQYAGEWSARSRWHSSCTSTYSKAEGRASTSDRSRVTLPSGASDPHCEDITLKRTCRGVRGSDAR